jgi:hypothetical protein
MMVPLPNCFSICASAAARPGFQNSAPRFATGFESYYCWQFHEYLLEINGYKILQALPEPSMRPAGYMTSNLIPLLEISKPYFSQFDKVLYTAHMLETTITSSRSPGA